MLIQGLLLAIAGISTAVLYGTAGDTLSLWWLLPILVGAYATLAILELTGLLLFAIATKRSAPSKARRLFYRICSHTAEWICLLCGTHVTVEGTDKLPTGSPFLLVSNHLSNLDPLVTMAALRGWELPFVSKPENFKIPFAGAIMKNAGFLPIDRENPRNAVASIKQAATNITTRELNMGIYTEGTRNKNRVGLLPFHNGSLKIATTAKCPIAVATLRYEKRTAHIKIVNVLDAAYVTANRTDAIGEKVYQLIAQDLGIE